MKNKLQKYYYKNCIIIKKIFVLGIICLVSFMFGFKNTDVPGLYFDAVYPDYIGTIFAFPGIDNFYEITRCSFFPLLGNFYHGTISAMVQFLIQKVTGNACVEMIWGTNLFVIALIQFIIFSFLYDNTKRFFLSLVMVLVPITSDHIVGFSRTQFYIFLDGALFIFIAMMFMYKLTLSLDEKDLIIAGLFHGLAFYGYFSYFIFIPVSIVYIAIIFKSKQIEKIFIFCWSVMLGAILYFWGYFDSLVINIFGKNNVQIMISVGGALIILAVFLWIPATCIIKRLHKYKKNIITFGCIAITMAIITIITILVKYNDIIISRLEPLGTNMSGRESEEVCGYLLIFWKYIYNLFCNSVCQELLIGEMLNKRGCFWIVIVLFANGITILNIIIDIRNKIEMQHCISAIIGINGYILGAYVISLPVISKLRTHHFTEFYFIIFALLGIEIAYLSSKVNIKKIVNIAFSFVVVVGVCLNGINNSLMYNKLEVTGGVDKFSTAFREYCESSVTQNNSDNIIYIFPEWGFYAPFVYLTKNSYKAIRIEELKKNDIQQYIANGYKIKIISWKIESIDAICYDISGMKYGDAIFYTKDGYVSFYERTLWTQ